jgi:hypothetical protein
VNEDRFVPVNNTHVAPSQTSAVGRSDNEQPVGFPYAALAQALRLDASTISTAARRQLSPLRLLPQRGRPLPPRRW